MPPPCSVCAHPRVRDIHRALEEGEGINATARAYEVAPSTLKLHLKHRPLELESERPGDDDGDDQEPVAVEDDLPLGDLEGRLHQLQRTGDRLRAAAENFQGALRERTTALAECRRTIAAALDLLEKLNERREVKVLASPQWAAVQAVVIEALRPFPEARAAVLEALRAHEGR